MRTPSSHAVLHSTVRNFPSATRKSVWLLKQPSKTCPVSYGHPLPENATKTGSGDRLVLQVDHSLKVRRPGL